MKKWIRSNSIYLFTGTLGLLSGYLYWKYVGCASGTCAITSRPINSAVYGMIMALLFTNIIMDYRKNKR